MQRKSKPLHQKAINEVVENTSARRGFAHITSVLGIIALAQERHGRIMEVSA